MLGEFGGDQTFCNKIIYLSESRMDFEENLLDLSFEWISPVVVLSFAMRMKDKKATFFAYIFLFAKNVGNQDKTRWSKIQDYLRK